jgi:hypothetical protein
MIVRVVFKFFQSLGSCGFGTAALAFVWVGPSRPATMTEKGALLLVLAR